MRNGDYILVIAPPEYPGKKYRGRYCYEHHLVWWQYTKECVSGSESIHHINGDRHDNNFSNLLKLSIAEHTALHNKDRGEGMVGMLCAYCGKTFASEARQIRAKVKSGQRDFYCNRSCMGCAFGRGRSK